MNSGEKMFVKLNDNLFIDVEDIWFFYYSEINKETILHTNNNEFTLSGVNSDDVYKKIYEFLRHKTYSINIKNMSNLKMYLVLNNISACCVNYNYLFIYNKNGKQFNMVVPDDKIFAAKVILDTILS